MAKSKVKSKKRKTAVTQDVLHAAQTLRVPKVKRVHKPDCKCGPCRGIRFEKGNKFAFRAGTKQPGSNKTPAELASIGGTVTAERTRGNILVSKAVLALIEQDELELGDDKHIQTTRKGGRTIAEAIADAVARAACGTISVKKDSVEEKISVEAAKFISEITEGKVPNKNEHTGAGGTALVAPTFNVVFRKPGEVV